MSRSPLPVQSPIGYTPSDPQTGRPGVAVFLETDAWDPYFRELQQAVGANPQQIGHARVQNQQATIAPTPLSLGVLAPGLYRVSYRTRITQAASTSSSLTISIGWTESALSLAQSGAALTGNTVTTQQSGVLLIRVDHASPITLAATYVSVGATPMKFEAEVTVERVPV